MEIVPLDIAFVVLHTSPLHRPGTKDAGGMNVVVLAQARELARAGNRVRLITRRSDEADEPVVELEPGLSVIHLDAGPARLLAKGDHEALIEPFGAALAAHLEDDPTDLIHAEHWYSGMAALPVARAQGVPMLQSYHSIAAADDTPLTDGERAEAPGRLDAERRLAHESDGVVTVSEAERETVVERLGGDPHRVHVVHPGVDTDLFHPNAGEDRGAARPEVIVAGRLHPLKGFDAAIAAIAALPPERRPALRLIGSPPPDGDEYEAYLHEQVEAAGMGDTVVFEGALTREALAARLRDAALVLIPSYSETYGLVALEAAASGVPVIARAIGGLVEAVADAETGLLVDGDAAEWAAAIDRVLGDPALAARMRDAAREHALARNWRAGAVELERVYRDVLERIESFGVLCSCGTHG